MNGVLGILPVAEKCMKHIHAKKKERILKSL